MSQKNVVSSRKSIVALASSLGITNPIKMKTPELISIVKECLYCNCIRMTIYIKGLRVSGAPKEKAIYVVSSFLKECPAGLTKSHKRYINELIFNLWVRKATVPGKKEVPAATPKKQQLPAPLPKLL